MVHVWGSKVGAAKHTRWHSWCALGPLSLRQGKEDFLTLPQLMSHLCLGKSLLPPLFLPLFMPCCPRLEKDSASKATL